MPNFAYNPDTRHMWTARESNQPVDNSFFEGRALQADIVLAWLIPLEGPKAGKPLSLLDGDTVIGRDPSKVHILLQNPTVSGIHAKITRRVQPAGETHYTLIDLGSSNGTWIDREEVFERILVDGTTLEFGNMKVAFKCL